MSTDTTADLTTLERTVDAYLQTWNETDPAARAELAAQALGADLWYRDPMLEADGPAAFDAMVAAVQAQFPGLAMRRTSDVDAHHDLVRFTWALGAPDAEPAVAGVDVAKFDAAGKLHRIIGFTPVEVPAA
jgi:hypothetical protein